MSISLSVAPKNKKKNQVFNQLFRTEAYLNRYILFKILTLNQHNLALRTEFQLFHKQQIILTLLIKAVKKQNPVKHPLNFMFMLQYIVYICNLEFRRPSHSNIYSINCMYIRQILHDNQLFHEKFKPKLSFECLHLNYVMVQHDNHCVKKPQASKKKRYLFYFCYSNVNSLQVLFRAGSSLHSY